MALLSAFAALYRSKVDANERALAEVREKFVSREELDKHLAAIATARKDMHLENSGRLERIEDNITKGLERIHDRIDNIPFRLPGTRSRSTDR